MDFSNNRSNIEEINKMAGCGGKDGENGYCLLREFILVFGVNYKNLEPTKNRLTRAHKETIEDICGCKGKRGNNGSCALRELISEFDDRALEQIKCIEIFKYERGISGEYDGWPGAMKIWRDEKYTEKFAEVYKPGMKSREIYNQMFLKVPKDKI